MNIIRFAVILLLSSMLVSGVACWRGGAELDIEPSLPAGARVEVAVERVEKTPFYPEELGEQPSTVLLEVGEEYAVIYLNLETVEGGQVRSLWADTELLLDTDCNEYKVQNVSWSDISLKNPNDFAGSPREVLEGADGVMAFIVPEEAELSVLRLTYSFSRDWEEPRHYQLDIALQ
ncbi:MAG TPA: hypothetical protein G4O13_05710 [Dehalococcoidia bacterium]|nr:hypothetical protein [Dehalococcoidia bacterium]